MARRALHVRTAVLGLVVARRTLYLALDVPGMAERETYETGECTVDSDRVCTACSDECTGSTYESTACNPTTNRVCSPCDDSCATCSGPDSDDCTGCPSGFNLSSGVCLPATPCAGLGVVSEVVTCDQAVYCLIADTQSEGERSYEVYYTPDPNLAVQLGLSTYGGSPPGGSRVYVVNGSEDYTYEAPSDQSEWTGFPLPPPRGGGYCIKAAAATSGYNGVQIQIRL